VAKLTLIIDEATNLRTQAAEARRHVDEAREKVMALLGRSRKDEEVTVVLRKERDELL
jgi:hypothetical protein